MNFDLVEMRHVRDGFGRLQLLTSTFGKLGVRREAQYERIEAHGFNWTASESELPDRLVLQLWTKHQAPVPAKRR